MVPHWIYLASILVSAGQLLARPQPFQIPLEPLPGSAAEERWSRSELQHHLEDALAVMQSNFFETWLGQWPDSIDWTGAVVGTHVAATLNTLASSVRHSLRAGESESCSAQELRLEDIMNKYFAQLTAYYFGENAFSIRTQAHDDMLWVVLGWLESLKLIQSHGTLHPGRIEISKESLSVSNSSFPWHGILFIPAFAHRSRIFYDIVSKAWDREICGGGLTWNPHLEPYKNAVTNTQFVSAAIGMYLYHPGDSIDSPFMSLADKVAHQAANVNSTTSSTYLPPAIAHDPSYLSIAKEAHEWLQNINMTNDHGLFVDGFHVRSYYDPVRGRRVYGSCDLRNEMVYTYNQGVILSGRRQLWEATGNTTYLQVGHELVRNVIAATGFPENETDWKGIGYSGLLTEFCDSRSTCSQDGQTFKGIFMHHFASFCEPLPTENALIPGTTFLADAETASLHASSCSSYIPWIERNAVAAWKTRNSNGIMGSWWGAPTFDLRRDNLLPRNIPRGATDTRNEWATLDEKDMNDDSILDWDLNDRGRGRTVESHSGGLAVLRALYALKMFYD